MSAWSDLVQDLEATDDEELEPDHLADLWILLGASSGSNAAGTALVALADPDIAVRALSHVISPIDDRLSMASRRFLRNLVAHSSEHDIDVWVRATRQSLATSEPGTDPEAALAALRAELVDAGRDRWVVGQPGSGKTNLILHFLAARLSPDEKLTAAAELASLHPDLEVEERASIRALLSTVVFRDHLVGELAGQPRRVCAAVC